MSPNTLVPARKILWKVQTENKNPLIKSEQSNQSAPELSKFGRICLPNISPKELEDCLGFKILFSVIMDAAWNWYLYEHES